MSAHSGHQLGGTPGHVREGSESEAQKARGKTGLWSKQGALGDLEETDGRVRRAEGEAGRGNPREGMAMEPHPRLRLHLK